MPAGELDEALARLEALLSPRGHEVLARLTAEDTSAGAELRLAASLRERYPAGLVADAFTQHELRLRARAKFSHAADMFFTRAGLEQASQELVSQYRAKRYHSCGRIADLCCGIGGDLLALADSHDALAVDRDPLTLRVAIANARACGVAHAVTPVQADVRDVDLTGLDAVFVDPARRTGGRRMATGVSEPPLAWCVGLAGQVTRVGIKAAPGLAHQAVPAGWELEFIAAGRDLKEAAVWSPALATARTRATILPAGHTLVPATGDPVEVRMPGEYLLDPNPAVTRAGLVAELARAVGAWQIDSQIAFLSAATQVQTPFARTLRVLDSVPWRHRDLRARLRSLGIGAVEVRRRGLAGDVAEIRRQLKLSGPGKATLVMTRVSDAPWALVCADVGVSSASPPPPRLPGPPPDLPPPGGRPARPRPGARSPGTPA
ncbi:MAG TPA: class I SAM-dependent methyltransferase [Streptosporangiaceae bacterium]|nr:class I SAM-dependent methyltransferase [Streptosporangiaceae bacterium]